MQTKKLSNSLVMIGTRLVTLIALMIALIANSSGVAAAPAPNLGTVTVGAQTGTLNFGTAGSATFSVTVTRTSGTPSSFNLGVSSLPSGATYSVSTANPISFSGNSSRTVTLTVNSTASNPLGSSSFTVTASQSGATTRTGAGTLTVSKGNQTITFASLPNKTTSDPDFNVSATASSGLSVSFAASGTCTIAGTLVHITGAGTCTVTASQAGNTNYNAATNVARTFAITSAGPATTFDLCATTGSMAVPGGTVPVWGYTLGDCTGAPAASVPGPQLTVNEGATVSITLHNNLGEQTALLFPGQSMRPDLIGAAQGGGTQTYTFTADRPGTFLYEAGLLPNAQHQVAMGMYGALIVRPAASPTQAYSDPSTMFDQESVLVLAELDTALNNSASPSSFDMRNYQPKYFLINGKTFPNTANVDVTPNKRVLLRYINAGLQAHAMSTLGVSQTIIAQDGSPYALSHKVVAETIATGQTLDTLVTIPSTTVNGSKFAVYDANMLLRNNSGSGTTNSGFGGMMMFLAAGEGSVGGFDTTGPATLNVTLPASKANGTMNVSFSASVSDVDSGGSNVTAAEYFIDTTGANGTGMPLSGSFGTPGPITVTATINASTIAGLSTGNHLVYVHALDSATNWGSFNQGPLYVDNTAPNVTSPSLSPNRSNGSANIALSATADDTASGNSNIGAAEYWIDSGSAAAMNVVSASPISGISATIPAAAVLALAEGSHTVHLHARDVLNTAWGPENSVSLTVDKTGPATNPVTAAPNPNNGALPYNTSVQAVRVTATFADPVAGGVNSNVAAAEGFIDTVGANGSGIVFLATDGVFNSASETGYADFPLAVVNSLSVGNHTIYVHGKDSSGNWGLTSTTILVIDKTAPSIVSINRADPSPTSAASVNFTVTFSEAMSGVSASSFSVVQGGGLTGASVTAVTGTGATRTVTVSTGSGGGTLGLNLASAAGITDVAGNALPSTGLPFVGQVYTLITPPLYFSTSGTTNPPGVGGTADDADIYYWNGSAFSRVIDVSATPYSLPTGANVDGFDRVSATSFYMSFTGTVSVPGVGNVDDEDIVFFNGSAWSLYFNGGTNGLGGTTTSTSFDLDAISIVGTGGPGNVYFSTDNNNVPSGAGGSGDDADVYRWNGGSSYTRVVDASTIGIPSSGTGNANVDGLVLVDATHFYLSFAADASISGFGTVQDEDVVYYSAGTWSVYFDGTAKGLTSGNLDVDAFDLP
jgi:FtsP/CotA-like multicopper oxidase with cupredoxin domain